MTPIEITLALAGLLILIGCCLVARCDAEYMGTEEQLFDCHPSRGDD